MSSKPARRVEVDEKTRQIVELDYVDRNITTFAEIAPVCKFRGL